uniref:Uncharacterized protein n=1 Tax=Meloidogyne enterolobii TaxID=390850 RepID=A0A6V7W0C5_MELEN|nr:unnamed protein product [Meloidogyne enterolobii]
MEETLNPHLAFSEGINDCLKGIKDIHNLQKSLFENSGLEEWRQTKNSRVEKRNIAQTF